MNLLHEISQIGFDWTVQHLHLADVQWSFSDLLRPQCHGRACPEQLEGIRFLRLFGMCL